MWREQASAKTFGNICCLTGPDWLLLVAEVRDPTEHRIGHVDVTHLDARVAASCSFKEERERRQRQARLERGDARFADM